MNTWLENTVLQPGFLSSGPVHIALITGGMVALVSGVVGVFTVIRGQSFAGHAFSGVGTTGGSGAFLLGINPIWGFFIVGLTTASLLELFGANRHRERDSGTGVMLSAALGLSSLFIYLDTTLPSASGITQSILFGSIFTVSGMAVPIMITLSLVILGATTLLRRPLFLSSISLDMAAAKSGYVRWVNAIFLLMMSVSVAMASMTVGAILSTALIIGPAATAIRLVKRPDMAMALAGVIGVISVWLGILLAYDSAAWTGQHAWPASFCIVSLILVFYLFADFRNRVDFNLLHVRRTDKEESLCLPD